MIYLDFYGDDTQGSVILQPTIWYHMVYIYDYPTRTQFVYINGKLDKSNSNKGSYKGDSEVLTVSYTSANNLLDNGPLGINGAGTNFQFTAFGRIDQGLDLLVDPSYVQVTGLVYLDTKDYPYSVAVWIRPTMITNGTIIHVSSDTNDTSWSMSMLGFTSAGNVGVQDCTTSNAVSITEPVVATGMWTHLTVAYAQSNQLRLWINETVYGTSSTIFTSSTADAPVTVTLADRWYDKNF
ncbi:unnamed protein product [Didymodactylos carnosus]|uniref:LamG domain-containing protein n=1 Tax=Didymodactylos carnosus TaxID=1234261 RepID=A0A814G6P2_9BILA|nr:unnamed protein product [Didymodactylos carnosus]CAF3765427.1 unnamed protein product [Didymodactylos carnosus]